MKAPDSEYGEEYVEARRILLDALFALGPQRDAVVLAGAQAIYLRTGPGDLAVAEFTTDGDLTLDPALLRDAPTLDELMEGAGFKLAIFNGGPEPGIWTKPATVNGILAEIPVDLLVPEGMANTAGSRGARLGPHGRWAARKTPGLEAVLFDHDVMRVTALDPTDGRSSKVKVAGIGALLVAKAHKLNDRISGGRPRRVDNKDAADTVRLMQASKPGNVAQTLAPLVDHPTAGVSVRLALEHFQALFGSRAGVGISMASDALRNAMPEDRVRAICLAYAETLDAELRDAIGAPTERARREY